jgi:hypothetical protein
VGSKSALKLRMTNPRIVVDVSEDEVGDQISSIGNNVEKGPKNIRSIAKSLCIPATINVVIKTMETMTILI